MNLQEIFYKVLEASKRCQQKIDNFDGLAFWTPIKKILQKKELFLDTNWAPKIDNEVKNKIRGIDDYDSENRIIECNHFLIQQVRIPDENEKISLRKLIQIALNIGQFLGSKDNKDLINFVDYNKLKLHVIESYINEDDLSSMSLILNINNNILLEISQYLDDYLLKNIMESH